MATNTLADKPGKDNPADSRRIELFAGAILLALGTVLLTASVGYQVYGWLARSNLDQYSFAVERPQFAGQGYDLPASQADTSGVPGTQPTTVPAAQPDAPSVAPTQSVQTPSLSAAATTDGGPVRQQGSRPAAASESPSAGSGASAGPAKGGAQAIASTDPPSDGASSVAPSAPAVSSQTGGATTATRWPASETTDSDEPPQYTASDDGSPSDGVARPAEPDPRLAAIEASIAELATYSAPTPADLALPGARATRIRIPTIGVDAVINELKILLLNSSLAWETPNQVVGHIPTTAAAGAQGEGWYFGHLESPLKGEGNVFARLPEITKLAGDAPVYIFLETPDRHYAYQVYVTIVVYQDDLSLTDSGKYDITLVTCTPRLYYDHRLLVTAALVGVKEA